MEKSMMELVLAARKGDQQAMAELYERTSGRAFYLALQLVKDEDQAQDILQDSYIKAFNSLDMLEDAGKFQGWLNTIVVNNSKNYLKKKKPILFSQMASEDEDDAAIDFEDESDRFSPEATVDYSETRRLVQAMIDGLPEEQRIAIVLHYLEDCPVKQIAAIMECSEGTVKSRLNYGRKTLKAKVLELEKKGTKLYCVPFVPFLVWMFHQDAMAAVAAPFGAAIAGGTAAGSAAAGSASAGAASAGSGAATAGSGMSAAASGTASVGSGAATTATGAASAGSGAAGASAATAEAAAGVAGKTGLTILGKAIGAKGVAVAAAVCLAGGGAVGGVYALRNQSVPESAIEETLADETEFQTDMSQEAENVADASESLLELTEEERAALKRLYQAMGAEDANEMLLAIRSDFYTLYAVEHNHVPNQLVIFDGENLSPDLDGRKLVLKICSEQLFYDEEEWVTIHTSNPNVLDDPYHYIPTFTITAYFGDFIDNVPNGSILSTKEVYHFYHDWIGFEAGPGFQYEIRKTDYDMGAIVGNVETQQWYFIEYPDKFSLITTTSGAYKNQIPTGEFEVDIVVGESTLLSSLLHQKSDSGRMEYLLDSEWLEKLDGKQNLVFHINAEEVEKHKKDREYYIPDDEGVSYVNRRILTKTKATDTILFWNTSNVGQHDGGTEDMFPGDGVIMKNGEVVWPLESKEDSESDFVEESEEYAGEDVEVDVDNLTEEQQYMQAPMDSIAYELYYSSYDPDDTDYFWSVMRIMVNFYPYDFWDKYTEHYAEAFGEIRGCYPVEKETVREYASAMFADYDGEISEEEARNEGITVEDGVFYFVVGDRGDEAARISSWIEHPDGTCTARTQILSGVYEEVYGEYEFELVKNRWASSFENPKFLYSVASAKRIQ